LKKLKYILNKFINKNNTTIKTGNIPNYLSTFMSLRKLIKGE
jgi:hypothetical protein